MINYLWVMIMKEKITYILKILLGNTLIAFALSTLFFENNIICGGVSGIGLVINHYFNLPISSVVAVVNVSLFFLGLYFLGKEFAMTTLASTIIFPVILEYFESTPYFHHYLDDPFMAAILAGCLVGIGIGLVLKANASTGGVDILALVINKKYKVPVHIVLNVIDIIVLVLQFSFSNTTNVIYGIMITFITSTVLNKTLSHGTSLIQLTVMSDHYVRIKEAILNELDAGATLILTEKGYTSESSKLVMSIIPYRKLPEIKSKIHDIDPLAFVIVSKVDEVGGKGFTLDR